MNELPTGFNPIDRQSGRWGLYLDSWLRARLHLCDAQFQTVGVWEFEPNPDHPHYLQVELHDLPPAFAYSWQIQRLSSSSHTLKAKREELAIWGSEFADPFHPWLAGQHFWNEPSRFDFSWVELNQLEGDLEPDKALAIPSDLLSDPSCVVQTHLEHPHLNRPHLPIGSLRIYECHVRAATMNHPSIDPSLKGTLEALPLILDHLQNLGFNAIELMPIQEFDERQPSYTPSKTGAPQINFWGYMPLHCMAIMRAYSAKGTSLDAEIALKSFVSLAHQRGMEVFLDVVFNHVDLQEMQGLWQSLPESGFFRSIKGELIDYSGCGNTLQVQNELTGGYVLDCLRHWALNFGIDGFRFDLAAAFARKEDGSCDPRAPFLQRLSSDLILKDCKLLVEPWDAKGAWLVGSMAPLGFIEWNDRYRDDLRQFIHFGKGKALAANRLSGSSDLYAAKGEPYSINYITCHDGFTLNDLVSYERRHNELNGESGRDGHSHNLSRNHGFEGLSQEPLIQELRQRQAKNFLLILALTHGPIMLLSGDEYGHSRRGNNNPWCQDNELNAFDWSRLEIDNQWLSYWQKLVAWRKGFTLLEAPRFYSATDCLWYNEKGQKEVDWSKDDGRLLFELRDGEKSAFAAFNSQKEALLIDLPYNADGSEREWSVIACSEKVERAIKQKGQVRLEGWSSLLLELKPCSMN